MTLRYSLKLLDSSPEIQDKILIALRDTIDKTIKKSIPKISQDIKNIVRIALESEPEYASLMSGTLRYHFGIEDTSNVNTVIEKLLDSLDIQITPINITQKGLSGGFKLYMINSADFGGALQIDAAKVSDQNKGYSLPWLEWLVLRNNEIIVKNYEVKIGPNKYSRTGNAVMIESSESWRVPPEFAGSVNNNWVTRALDKTEQDIINIIETTIASNI